MASTTTVLPQLQAFLDMAPAGSNPYGWWANTLHQQAYPGVAPKSVAFFYIIEIIACLNFPLTLATIFIKYRSEGGISYYKLRDHSSGGRYICLNATSFFLTSHVLSCVVFMVYPMLHIHRYNTPGHGWSDLGWAVFMWIVPFIGLLLTFIGVIYAILVTASPLAYARRAPSDGQLVSHQPPLARTPCWLLNAFIFAAPIVTLIGILVPGIRLIHATRSLELYSHGFFETIQAFATNYAEGIVPAVAQQAAFLESIVVTASRTATAAARWRPVFCMWLVFGIIAFVIASVAFFGIVRVTSTRLQLVRQQLADSEHDSGNFELDESQRWDKKQEHNPRQSAAIKQARSEYYSLSVQFAAGAILFLACDAVLFIDVVIGWKTHTNRDLLAATLLPPSFAYLTQGTASVILTLVRAIRSKQYHNSEASTVTSPRSNLTGHSHTRTDSDMSISDKKASYYNPTKSGNSGAVFVTAMPKHKSFPVSPSVIHQIQISQTVEMNEDTASIAESKYTPNNNESESYTPIRSEAALLGAEGSEIPVTHQDLAYGRAL
ncbi:MAG: hypothetical protein CYPHOPRED_002002 [Cyphobasidiales sp. Tagirdzhanova-0007]|nr:MAG: hypothetical protein CYPHOPRED_002002 [Cyphobasidiales sp. Tagirdzhanova-0007]